MASNEFNLEQFKVDYEENGKYDLKAQIPHLAALAEKYLKKYQDDGDNADWKDCLKAHSLFNSVGARDEPVEQRWHDKVNQVQESFWGESVEKPQSDTREHVDKQKLQLQKVRDDTRDDLKKATDIASMFPTESLSVRELDPTNDFIHCVKYASISCTDKMLAMLEQIMNHCVMIMKEKPPCSFSVVAIGSMARGEATPYSDLEYMFLLESGCKTEESELYFEKLAIITYFIIGNFRETKLSYMAVDELMSWFEDTSQNGLKIDGLAPQAGNIPTGNGIPKTRDDEHPSGNISTENGSILTRNHFIATPEEIAQRYKSVFLGPNEAEALNGDFTAMLAYMKEVYTFRAPQNQGCNILQNLRNMLAVIEPNEKRKEMNMKMLVADMEKFNFKPDVKLIGKMNFTLNVKKDLYRFPSILVYDLSIVCGCFGDSVWKTIDLLHEKKYISQCIRDTILFLLACACYVRLSTYLYHDSHDDRVSLLQTLNGPVATQNRESSRWQMPEGLLYKMCDRMTPLKEAIRKTNSASIRDVLRLDEIKSDWWCDVKTRFYCGWFAKALDCLKSKFGFDTICSPPALRKALGDSGYELNPEMHSVVSELLLKAGHQQYAVLYLNLEKKSVSQALKGVKLDNVFKSSQSRCSGLEDFLEEISAKNSELDGGGDELWDMLGIDYAAFEHKLAISNSPSDPRISALHSIVRGIAFFISFTIRTFDNGRYGKVCQALVESGIRAAGSYSSYEEKVDAITHCIMWNGDVIGELFAQVLSQNTSSRRPNNLPSENLSATVSQSSQPGESKLEKFMKGGWEKRLVSVDSSSVVTWLTLLILGVWYGSIEKFDFAYAYIDHAKSIFEKKYGKGAVLSQTVALSMCRALCMNLQGRHADVRKVLNESCDIVRRLYGDQDPTAATLHEIMEWIKTLKPEHEENFVIQVSKLNILQINLIRMFIVEWLTSAYADDDLD